MTGVALDVQPRTVTHRRASSNSCAPLCEAPSSENGQSVDNTISLGPVRDVVEITCDSDQFESGRARDVCW
jgi:hypothetical protein